MAKPENTFNRPGSLRIEWQPKERGFICWRPHTSQLATSRKEVLRFARWPASTVTGQALREWLDTVLGAPPPPPSAVAPLPDIAATGFGPEHHEDSEPDPTANTRTII